VRRSLSTGGTIGLHAESRFSDSTYLDGSGFRTHADAVSISVTQPLLRGRGERYARADVRRARVARSAADLSRHGVALTTAREVIDAYWELVFALRDKEIRESSLALAQERLRITQLGIEGGAVAPTEALAVEQVIATREEEILGAELTIVDRSLALRRLVGLEIGPGEIELTTEAPLPVQPRSFDLDELLARAYSQSPELAYLEALAEGAEIDIEVTENGLLPRLDVSASIGPSGTDTTAGAALRKMVSAEDFTFSVGLTYQHTIGNRGARGVARRARAERDRVRLSADDVKLQIASGLARATRAASSAQRRMEISQRAIALAERNIEAEKSRFELGRATNFDVLQRQEELKQAQLRYVRAAIDHLRAMTTIETLTADLLQNYGIALD
jgi:outer membrane protein TolC